MCYHGNLGLNPGCIYWMKYFFLQTESSRHCEPFIPPQPHTITLTFLSLTSRLFVHYYDWMTTIFYLHPRKKKNFVHWMPLSKVVPHSFPWKLLTDIQQSMLRRDLL